MAFSVSSVQAGESCYRLHYQQAWCYRMCLVGWRQMMLHCDQGVNLMPVLTTASKLSVNPKKGEPGERGLWREAELGDWSELVIKMLTLRLSCLVFAVVRLLVVRAHYLRPGWWVSLAEPEMVHLYFNSMSAFEEVICPEKIPASPEQMEDISVHL